MKKLEIDWWHGYANSPDFVVHAEVPPWISFEYELIPRGHNDWLLSTNNDPWVRYVLVNREHRYGYPNQGGGLGGEYKLTNGKVYKTKTGWSSRASVINRDFPHLLPVGSGGLISEVTVKAPNGANWGGFNLTKQALDMLVADYNAEAQATQPVYIVHKHHGDGEISLVPSIHPTEVRKPTK